ncbi:MAG: hypothetical protein JWN84_4348 [Nocardioides sp.]|nr:hypothetical protein [Nocardioides sp.]
MSGLAALVARLDGPGVLRWESDHEVGDVRHVVEVAGGRLAHLDGARIDSAPALHAALAAALRFPDWYGANLDALADCLREVPQRVVLLWDDWATLAEAEPRVFDVALGLLGERVLVLLRGLGPVSEGPAAG